MELENPARLANLPLRLRGSYSNKFRSVNVCTNHYRVELANFQKIFIFSIRIQPFIPFDNKTLRQQVLKRGDGNLRQMISNSVSKQRTQSFPAIISSRSLRQSCRISS